MGYGKKEDKHVADVNISSCPASKTSCQGDNIGGIFCAFIKHKKTQV